MDPECILREGERAWIVSGGYILPNGRFVAADEDCIIEQGSVLSLRYYEDGGNRTMPPDSPDLPQPAEPLSMPLDQEPDRVPVPPVAPPLPPPATVAVPAPSVSVGDAPDLGAALAVGEMLGDNPWAPLLIVILAVVAVLGGRQGWKFWSERSARAHELELRRLELTAQAPTVQPPPCQAKDIEHDLRFSQLEGRVASLEKTSSSLPDWPEDALEELEKRLKKLERKPKPVGVKP